MLSENLKKIKEYLTKGEDIPKDIFLALLVATVGTGGYFVGRIIEETKGEKGRVAIESTGAPNSSVPTTAQMTTIAPSFSSPTNTSTQNTKGVYVGSKNGSVFHLPECSGAKNIKEENRIWFSSKEDAIAKGYKPAGNCKGI